jgi:hypothetical protein
MHPPSLAATWLFLAAICFPMAPLQIHAQLARPAEFRQAGGVLHAVLSGPELTRSWGDWVFFPFALTAPGDAVSGTIRTFHAGASDAEDAVGPSWSGHWTRKENQPRLIQHNLALISAPDPRRRAAFFPEPAVDAGQANNKKTNAVTSTGGACIPLPCEAEQLLRGGRITKFVLQRISATEFSFTLEPAESPQNSAKGGDGSIKLTLLSPDGDSYWGMTVCLGGDMWIELDPI